MTWICRFRVIYPSKEGSCWHCCVRPVLCNSPFFYPYHWDIPDHEQTPAQTCRFPQSVTYIHPPSNHPIHYHNHNNPQPLNKPNSLAALNPHPTTLQTTHSTPKPTTTNATTTPPLISNASSASIRINFLCLL